MRHGKDVDTWMGITAKAGTCVLTGMGSMMDSEVTLNLAMLTLLQKNLQGSDLPVAPTLLDIPQLLSMYKMGKLNIEDMITAVPARSGQPGLSGHARRKTSAASSAIPKKIGDSRRDTLTGVPILDSLSTWPVGLVSGGCDNGRRRRRGVWRHVGRLRARVGHRCWSRRRCSGREEGAIELIRNGPPGATVAHLLAHASGRWHSPRETSRHQSAPNASIRAPASRCSQRRCRTPPVSSSANTCGRRSASRSMPSTRLLGPAGHGARSMSMISRGFARYAASHGAVG